MKKLIKNLAAITSLFCLLSLVSCDMATEDELLATVGKTKKDNINTTIPANSNSGEASALWSMFDGADMQVWEKTATLTETAEGLDIEIGNVGWWGMCFCNAASVKPEEQPVTFDMSKVKKITFEAKASENASVLIAQSNSKAQDVHHKRIDLSTNYETKSYELTSPEKNAYGLFDLLANAKGGTAKAGVVISIKNIKFINADEVEIIPSRNE